MPMDASAPVARTHSWSLVYFRSAGYIASPVAGGASTAGALVERRRHHLGGDAPSANVDLEGLVDRRGGRRDVGQADGPLEERRLGAARDLAGFDARDVDRAAGPGDAAVDHLEADDAARDPADLLCLEGGLADEVGLLPADDPAQPGLEQRGRFVH